MNPLEIACPLEACTAKWPSMPCSGLSKGRSHAVRTQLAANPRQVAVPCPSCKSPTGMLCAHLSRGAPHWNVSYHPERDAAAYDACTDVVEGLTYPDGKPVKRPWIVRDKTIKKDKLRGVAFEVVGEWLHYNAATWDGRIWHGSGKLNDAKKKARSRSAIDRLADVVRPAGTEWKTEKVRASRKL